MLGKVFGCTQLKRPSIQVEDFLPDAHYMFCTSRRITDMTFLRQIREIYIQHNMLVYMIFVDSMRLSEQEGAMEHPTKTG